jgi:hypothetical protein
MNANMNAIKAMRAELLVKIFIEDLKPSQFLKAESEKLDFDFLVAFKKPGGGLKFCAIDVKQTDSVVNGKYRFRTGRRSIDSFKSNMPMIIIVADTKHNQLYYGLASEIKKVNGAHRPGFFEVAVPITAVGSSPADKRKFVKAVLNS